MAVSMFAKAVIAIVHAPQSTAIMSNVYKKEFSLLITENMDEIPVGRTTTVVDIGLGPPMEGMRCTTGETTFIMANRTLPRPDAIISVIRLFCAPTTTSAFELDSIGSMLSSTMVKSKRPTAVTVHRTDV